MSAEATRGSPRRLANDVHQVVIAPVGEHSAKPDEVYRRIERLYPGPRLELFARRQRARWTTWGDEVPREQMNPPTPRTIEDPPSAAAAADLDDIPEFLARSKRVPTI